MSTIPDILSPVKNLSSAIFSANDQTNGAAPVVTPAAPNGKCPLVVSETVLRIIEHLHRGAPERFTQDLATGQVYWSKSDEPPRFPPQTNKSNIYWCVNPLVKRLTQEEWDTVPRPKETEIAGKDETVGAVNALFRDVDGKTYAHPTEDEIEAQFPIILQEQTERFEQGKIKRMPSTRHIKKLAASRARDLKFSGNRDYYKALALAGIRAGTPSPTLIVDSGGGYNCYWFLVDTYHVRSYESDGDERRTFIANIQRRWTAADPHCDAPVCDLRRILRLPGAINHKAMYGPNFPTAQIIELDFERMYTLEELTAYLPPEIPKPKADPKPVQQSLGGSSKGSNGDGYISEYNTRTSILDALLNTGHARVNDDRLDYPTGHGAGSVVYDLKTNRSWHYSSSDPLHTEKDVDMARTPYDILLEWEYDGDVEKAYEFITGRKYDKQIDPVTKQPVKLLKQNPLQSNGNGAAHVEDNSHMPEPPADSEDEDLLAQMSASSNLEDAPDFGDPYIPLDPGAGDKVQKISKPSKTLDQMLTEIKTIGDSFTDDDDEDKTTRNAAKNQRKGALIDWAIKNADSMAALNLGDQNGLTTALGSGYLTNTEITTKILPLIKKAEKNAKRRAAAKKTAAGNTTNLPVIVVNVQPHVLAKQALEALVLMGGDEPELYIRSAVPVHIVMDNRRDKETEQDYERPVISMMNRDNMTASLGDAAIWVREDVNNDGEIVRVDSPVPSQAISQTIGRKIWPGVNTLHGIVTAPVFSGKGFLHQEKGYNKRTGLYYTGEVQLGDITPTPENLAKAHELIFDNLIVDFPFKDKSSKAHAVAYMILPFVRQMINGATPLHIGDAPTPGSGKGKLIRCLSHPFLGTPISASPEGANEDERRKNITALLMASESHVLFDNINQALDSSSFATAFTEPVWGDRLLGLNKRVSLTVETIWAATSNNIQMTEELVRRSLLIRLDANMEKPWERPTEGFTHENITQWGVEHRNELVTACCTLVRNWIDKGMPKFKGKAKGSYENWTKIVGGILQANGIEGFLENEAELFNRVSDKNNGLSEFVQAWWDLTKGRKTSAKDLFYLASYPDASQDGETPHMPADATDSTPTRLLDEVLNKQTQRGRETQLGLLLKKQRDAVIAGFKLIDAGREDNLKMWQLVSPNAPMQAALL